MNAKISLKPKTSHLSEQKLEIKSLIKINPIQSQKTYIIQLLQMLSCGCADGAAVHDINMCTKVCPDATRVRRDNTKKQIPQFRRQIVLSIN